MLDLARIQRARLLVIASPDGFHARRTLELARAQNPQIAVMGELELALEMTNYALRSLGVSDERSKLLIQWLRNEGVAGTPKDPGAH